MVKGQSNVGSQRVGEPRYGAHDERRHVAYRGRRYLSVLQRLDLGVEGGADDLVVPGVVRGSGARVEVEARQALGVRDGVVLPRVIGHAIQRALQDPVT